MLDIRIKVDERSLKEAARILKAIPRAMPRVMRRAIKKTVDKTVVEFKDKIVEKVNLKKGDIGRALKKTYSAEYGSIAAKYTRTGLLEFKGTAPSAHGVRYRIYRNEARKMIEHGFIQRMQSGHRGVFARTRKTRLPIQEKRGPSVWTIITGTPGLLKGVIEVSGNRMSKFINDQIGVEFRRWCR